MTNDMKLRCDLLRVAAYAKWIIGISGLIQLGLISGGFGLTYGLGAKLATIVPYITAIGGAGSGIGGLGLAGPFWDD